MESKVSDRRRFNLFLDGVIDIVSREDPSSMRYRTELFKFIGCCRQVADYDVGLARETCLAGLMVTYAMDRCLIHGPSGNAQSSVRVKLARAWNP